MATTAPDPEATADPGDAAIHAAVHREQLDHLYRMTRISIVTAAVVALAMIGAYLCGRLREPVP